MLRSFLQVLYTQCTIIIIIIIIIIIVVIIIIIDVLNVVVFFPYSTFGLRFFLVVSLSLFYRDNGKIRILENGKVDKNSSKIPLI